MYLTLLICIVNCCQIPASGLATRLNLTKRSGSHAEKLAPAESGIINRHHEIPNIPGGEGRMSNNLHIIPGIRSHPLNRLRAQRGVVEAEILAVAMVLNGRVLVTTQIHCQIWPVNNDVVFGKTVHEIMSIKRVVERVHACNRARKGICLRRCTKPRIHHGVR